VPAAADTFFWADAARSAGIAPAWRSLAQSTARSVVAAARDASSHTYADRARELADRMRTEDGARIAAELIHRHA